MCGLQVMCLHMRETECWILVFRSELLVPLTMEACYIDFCLSRKTRIAPDLWWFNTNLWQQTDYCRSIHIRDLEPLYCCDSWDLSFYFALKGHPWDHLILWKRYFLSFLNILIIFLYISCFGCFLWKLEVGQNCFIIIFLAIYVFVTYFVLLKLFKII